MDVCSTESSFEASVAANRSGIIRACFVDGDLTVADVFDSTTSKWKTVAVVGQAKGVSSGGENHYFALDVTDPEAMVPLWEFSDTLENRGAACLGARTRVEAVCEENPTCNDSCNQADEGL